MKIFLRTQALIYELGTIFLFLVIVLYLQIFSPFYNSAHYVAAAKIKVEPLTTLAPVGLPSRLIIESLNIDQRIESVGLTATGAMDTPKDPSGIGWFAQGFRPGAPGNAVITGHYGWKNNRPAAFDKLSDLKTGDIILATDNVGKTYSFTVDKVKIYKRDAIVPEIFASSDDSHLNLITCSGEWNVKLKEYENRLVVFTTKTKNIK
jgi:LPXTG-site transpeptidase (sortase) family protein